ncbi:MAG: ABC transporter ATP-binding protein [Ignavibacteria bacterium GWA2_35_9]|nr:MAG: ABC transporter ATP-binding protein [Ignavibacteria bacterium GWA2_35_9]OGU50007.1 MAG: ABC transporter ATP-binding protein [Ignavibacteria bacterium GWC2_36_12]
MSEYSLVAESVNKTFGRRLIFRDINFKLNSSTIFGISGPNGSGKSTLVKIIANIISPSSGKLVHSINGTEIKPEKLHNYIGLVSPYLVLYDEFTAYENLNYFSEIRGISFDKEKVDELLNKFLLFNRKDDLVKTYSSGMKQRLKFIFALMHSPQLIILDEPTSNLDDEGKEVVYQLVKEEGSRNVVIVASNEKTDLNLCTNKIDLNDYKV